MAAGIQIALDAGGSRRFEVSGLVAYENATTDIHWKALQEILDHPRCGLAPMACLTIPLYQRVGMERTVFERVYVSSDTSQVVCHPIMQCFNFTLLIQASGHS